MDHPLKSFRIKCLKILVRNDDSNLDYLVLLQIKTSHLPKSQTPMQSVKNLAIHPDKAMIERPVNRSVPDLSGSHGTGAFERA